MTFDPAFEQPDEFDEIMTGVRVLTPWKAAFDEAEETLLAAREDELRRGDFEIEDIGRAAWDFLPEAEREAAQDELFYTYWSVVQSDADELARYERERDVRTALRERLDDLHTLTGSSVAADREILERIADLAGELLGRGPSAFHAATAEGGVRDE